MDKILIPIDFYKPSVSAFIYGCKLAYALEAKVKVLHVISGTFNTYDPIQFDPIQSQYDQAKERLSYFISDYLKENNLSIPKIDIETQVKFGIPGFTIHEFAEEEKCNLIVMGTRDTHGIFDKLLGSTSRITIQQSKSPVILIHEKTEYKAIESAVFALDTETDLKQPLAQYSIIPDNLNNHTHFLHIKKDEQRSLDEEKDRIIIDFVNLRNLPFSLIEKSSIDKDMKTDLLNFCVEKKADILVMVQQNEGFWARLFKGYFSINIAQETILPVMILKE